MPSGSKQYSFEESVSQSVEYTFSSHLGLTRYLTVIVRVSTQHHIHAFTGKFGYTHKVIQPKELKNLTGALHMGARWRPRWRSSRACHVLRWRRDWRRLAQQGTCRTAFSWLTTPARAWARTRTAAAHCCSRARYDSPQQPFPTFAFRDALTTPVLHI